MRKLNASCVEKMARRHPTEGVFFFADDREAGLFEMKADLVFTPSVGLNLKQGSLSKLRLPGAGGAGRSPVDPLLQHPFFPGNGPGHDHLVGFSDLAFSENTVEVLDDPLRFSDDEATAGFTVEPMDDVDGRMIGTMTFDPGLYASLSHGNPERWLINHKKVVVLEKDRKGSVERGNIQAVGEKEQFVTALQGMFREPHAPLVHPDAALVDDASDLAKRKVDFAG